MIFAIYLATLIISYNIFKRNFYGKISKTSGLKYTIPQRFYFYFLFIKSIPLLLLATFLYKSPITQSLFFIFTYSIVAIFLFFIGFKWMSRLMINIIEKCIQINLITFSTISIISVALIFYSIFANSIFFFQEVGITNFLFKTQWSPENYLIDPSNSFGIIPLIINTLYITLFSLLVSFFFGLLIAVHISEYIKSKRTKFVLKSLFEIVSGIPSIFYGFFGAFFLAPKISEIANSLNIFISIESIIIPGIAIGIMMIPYVATLLDDVFSSVPKTLKDSSTAMGLTKFETIKNLIIPISMPEIISTLIIVISRVLGETMVVLLTCGIVAIMTLNPLNPSTTITVQIVHLLTGDTSFETSKTLSVFALSLFLFVTTLILNLASIKIKNRSKKI